MSEKSELSQEQKDLRKFHKLSDRHILIAESDLTDMNLIRPILNEADRVRRAGNELVGEMRKRYQQLIRTKKYRGLLKVYGKTKDKEKHKELGKELNSMQEEYNVTWEHCRKSMLKIADKYNIHAVFKTTKAEDVWRAVEKCLYSNGEDIHFSKYDVLPSLRAKEINRGIPIHIKDNELYFEFRKQKIGLKVKDRFQTDEINAILNYLYNTESLLKQVHSRATGTTSVAAIYPQSLNTLEYMLPTYDEQSKIGELLLDLDNLITLHQRKHNKLNKIKQSLLNDMFV